MGGGHRRGGANIQHELGVNGVVGANGGLHQIDRAPAGAAVVTHRPVFLAAAQGEGQFGGSLVHLAEGAASLQRGGQHEGLEGGAGLASGSHGQVDLGVGAGAEIIAASYHGHHPPRGRLHGHEGGVGLGAGVGQDIGHGAFALSL